MFLISKRIPSGYEIVFKLNFLGLTSLSKHKVFSRSHMSEKDKDRSDVKPNKK